MPFGYNLEQVFMMIMHKTMWDFNFNNNNGFGGFSGGNFMNSCWGNGFSMQGGLGDYCQFNNTPYLAPSTPSNPSTPTRTVEEQVKYDMSKDKFNSLRKVVLNYVNSLGSTKEERTIKETFNRIGSTYTEENLSKLQEFYEEHTTDILKNSNNTTSLDFLDSDKEKMDALVTTGRLSKASTEQITALKTAVPAITKFMEDNNITDLYIDEQTITKQLFVRYIDKNGDIKSINGVLAEKDSSGNITFEHYTGFGMKDGKVAAGSSWPIEEMRNQKLTMDSVVAEKNVLKKSSVVLTQAGIKYQLFEEKKTTGERNYKRVFFIDNKGNLKELKNTYITVDSKDKKQKLFWKNGQKEWEYIDADLDSIKGAAN